MKFTKDFLETILESVKEGGTTIEIVLEFRYDVNYDQFEISFVKARRVET